MPAHNFSGLSQLPFYAALGLACGVLAVVINKGLFAIEGGFRRLPVNPFWLPAIGAFGFACIGVAVPRSLGVGYDQIGDVLNGRLAVGALAILAIAKLASWWMALASGTSGGTLAPLLLISGSFGALARSPRAVDPGCALLARRVRARGDGRDVRRVDPRDVHVDHLSLRAHA